MKITNVSVSADMKLSQSYQSSGSALSIEIELGGEDPEEVMALWAAKLRAACLREARAGLVAIKEN